jgi:putative ABC transport system permease protein
LVNGPFRRRSPRVDVNFVNEEGAREAYTKKAIADRLTDQQVISGSVTRRAHAFAVRLALGADHDRVLRIVLGDGACLVAIGLLLGAPGVCFAGRIIRSVLVGVSPLDPLTLGAVAAGLALVAMVACYLPARRLLELEPAQSLRQ